MTVHEESRGAVRVVTIDCPEARNAVDGPTAEALVRAPTAFDAEPAPVAVLTARAARSARARTEGGRQRRQNRCADEARPDGAVAHAARQAGDRRRRGPRGRGRPGARPVVRPARRARDAVFGVFCRRWGVPLIDGGTVRLPRLIGIGPALDLILTGRAVTAEEALRLGLVSRAGPGGALAAAIALAEELTRLPQARPRPIACRCSNSRASPRRMRWPTSSVGARAPSPRPSSPKGSPSSSVAPADTAPPDPRTAVVFCDAAMMAFSDDPHLAEQQLHAVIYYLTAIGYIDGDFDGSEKAFVRDYISKLVAHRIDSVCAGLDAPQRQNLTSQYTQHFHEVFHSIDYGIRELFTESVSSEEETNEFVYSKLKLRQLRDFRNFSPRTGLRCSASSIRSSPPTGSPTRTRSASCSQSMAVAIEPPHDEDMPSAAVGCPRHHQLRGEDRPRAQD